MIANVVINNGLSHIHTVEGGQIIKGKIEILNTDNKPQAVKIYQRDYHFDYKGQVSYDEPNSNKRSNAAWIDFSPSYLEVEAKGEAVVLYEIKIPADADLSGTYWSVLMVEGISSITPELPEGGVNISTIMRYAIQLATNIGETGTNNLEFVDAKLDKIDGNTVGSIGVVNSGERLLTPEVSIELFNEAGQSVSIVKATKKKIYPGTSTRFYLDLIDLPKGNYEAVILADCSEEDIFGLNLSLSLRDD